MANSAAHAYKLTSLPIISIAPYLHPHDGKGRLSTAAAIHAACLDYGFFYLDISCFIDPSEPEELTRLAREFFTLPQAEKDKISLRNEDNARGYAKLKENVTNGLPDNHEGIDYFRPVEEPDKSKPLWGENQWPDVPGFREKYEKWVEKMKELGMMVMEAMAVGLGLTPEEWDELHVQVDDPFWVMRVIGYPPLPSEDEGLSCGAHKDYGCLTFLYQDPTKNALEVLLTNPGSVVKDDDGWRNEGEDYVEEGGVWINADPVPGCVVCNIGEMWEIWTNGLYKSTLHRVVHRGSNYRIPFFYEPNFNALVKPLEGAVRLQEGMTSIATKTKVIKKYDPVVYGEFLLDKVSNNFSKYPESY
ncbi:hypothetical protein JAAARDRAFT_122490 [Jaapia argillacea MUCL 33604]|uniref:Fe2OG dioxygenase domain-containing protein n=1 Tax=Jaapia argillacea MUCL 33604 TaxID=933084 RepID=A0A067QG25_9AGAM|nr:hypothetical protein JAAARDRAFT_122490 [Jaapia argillacea MUCL 33604]